MFVRLFRLKPSFTSPNINSNFSLLTTTKLEISVNHVAANCVNFNFSDSLLKAIAAKWDARVDISPPPSPLLETVAFADLSKLSDLTDLSDLSDVSPLTSLSSSPSSSPYQKSVSLENLCPLSPIPRNDALHALPHVPLASNTNNPVPLGRNAKRKARRHAAGQKSRKKARAVLASAPDSQHKARDVPHKKFVQAAPKISSNFNTAEAPVVATAYVALDSRKRSKKIFTLDELVGPQSKHKFRLIKWDGQTPMTILDKDCCLVAILAGHPDDPNWTSVHSDAAHALESCRSRVHVPKQKSHNRRGVFPALSCGVSHGGGQCCPGNLLNSPPNDLILQELNALKPFQRIAGFASSVMATWAPKLHRYYAQTVNDLHANDPSLHRNFPSCVFSAASYNFGPRTLCFRHKDFANLPFGLCAVTSLGSFDPTKGGHMVLWFLGLVIEFPPGSTNLLPSAIVEHCNTAISKHEKRYSFAQYTAGGLFRWVDSCCSKRENYLSSLSPEERELEDCKASARWAFGLSLLPTFPDVEKPAPSS